MKLLILQAFSEHFKILPWHVNITVHYFQYMRIARYDYHYIKQLIFHKLLGYILLIVYQVQFYFSFYDILLKISICYKITFPFCKTYCTLPNTVIHPTEADTICWIFNR